jgi:HD-like signal output (HDOD) protein
MAWLKLGKKSDPKAKIREVLGDYKLPSFPGAIMQILQKIRDPKSSVGSVAEILAIDPGLSVQVLRVANSAAYSPARKIENLTQAAALIGLSELQSLVLSFGVRNNMPSEPVQGYDCARFWRAAARRGFVARGLSTLLCPARESESFTAGLLQDMAVPFLAHQRTKEYGPVLSRWHSGDSSLYELEQAEFGWDHAEVATWICDEWNLPENIEAAIGSHHGVKDDVYDCPPSVALAAYIRETPDSPGTDRVIEVAETRYNIPGEKVRQIIDAAFEQANDFSRLLG